MTNKTKQNKTKQNKNEQKGEGEGRGETRHNIHTKKKGMKNEK